MRELNYERLPPQVGYTIDIREVEGFRLHPESTEYERQDPDEPLPDKVSYPFAGNSFRVGYVEGDPGTAIPWHTHATKTHQVYSPLEGRIAVNYRDNAGEVHRTEAGVDEWVYLPSGAHNKIEFVGGSRGRFLVSETAPTTPRIDHLVGDVDSTYDPTEDQLIRTPGCGLELDTLRGDVVQRNAGVEEY